MTAALSGKLLADWEESCKWRDKIILFGVTFFLSNLVEKCGTFTYYSVKFFLATQLHIY